MLLALLTFAVDACRTDHMDDYILERTAMPDENIRKANGETVFEEERPMVCVCVPLPVSSVWLLDESLRVNSFVRGVVGS